MMMDFGIPTGSNVTSECDCHVPSICPENPSPPSFGPSVGHLQFTSIKLRERSAEAHDRPIILLNYIGNFDSTGIEMNVFDEIPPLKLQEGPKAKGFPRLTTRDFEYVHDHQVSSTPNHDAPFAPAWPASGSSATPAPNAGPSVVSPPALKLSTTSDKPSCFSFSVHACSTSAKDLRQSIH